MNMKSIIFSWICTCGAFGLHAAVNSSANPVKNQQQVTEVKGIGEKMAAKIATFVSFS